jgi:hypothetical protein
MGWILKLALLALAIYAIYRTFSRWKGLYDRFVGKPDEPERKAPAPPPPPQTPPPQAKRAAIEDAQTCGVCGAFFAAGASNCGQPNCPLP